jgi:hypothetical protein
MGDLPYTDRLVVERDGSGGDDASVPPAPKPPAGGGQSTSDVAGEAFLGGIRCHRMSPRCRLWSRANAGGLMMLPLSALTRRALVAATTASWPSHPRPYTVQVPLTQAFVQVWLK